MIDFDARIVRDGHLHTLRVQALDVDQARHQLQADGAQVISLQARRALNLSHADEVTIIVDRGKKTN